MAIYYGDGSNSSDGRLIQTFEVGYESRWFVNNPSGSWHDGPGNLGNGINITPKDNNNKILIRFHMNFGHEMNWTQAGVKVYRKIGSGSHSAQYGAGCSLWNKDRTGMHSTACGEYWDSPGTTSVVNYKLMFTAQNSGNYIRLNYGNLGSGGDTTSDQSPRSTLTVQEIAV